MDKKIISSVIAGVLSASVAETTLANYVPSEASPNVQAMALPIDATSSSSTGSANCSATPCCACCATCCTTCCSTEACCSTGDDD